MVKVQKDKSVRLRTLGKRAEFRAPDAGMLHITVGFRDPTSDAQNACSSVAQPFRSGRTGRLIAP
jgi:hypothetical protein